MREAVRRLMQTRALGRAGASTVRLVLSGRSLEQLTRNPLLARMARFPIPDRFFELPVPEGATIELHGPSAPYLYWAGFQTYEPEVVPTFLERVSDTRSFVDVGASFGFYSLLAWRRNESAEITAVEPNPQVAEGLSEAIARNRARIVLLRKALADRSGTVDLELRGGLSSIVPERWEEGSRRVRVEAVTFDEAFPRGVELVKIDAEGAELLILEGMGRALSEPRPTIICEIDSANVESVITLLRAFDYRVLSLPGCAEVAAGDTAAGGSGNFLLEPS